MPTNDKLPNILVLIGGILSVLQGITSIIGWASFWGTALRIIFGIIAILVGLLLITSSGYLSIELPVKIPFEGIPLLIVGILLAVFGSWLGGVLVIIAAVLLLL